MNSFDRIHTLFTRLTVWTVLLASTVSAQLASVTSYGSTCPPGVFQIVANGLPQLGASFRIDTGPTACNGSCVCTKVLAIGWAQTNAPFVVPGFFAGSGCPVLATPDILTIPGLSIAVPADQSLIGLQFFTQCAELTSCFGVSIRFSQGLHCTVGL